MYVPRPVLDPCQVLFVLAANLKLIDSLKFVRVRVYRVYRFVDGGEEKKKKKKNDRSSL